MKERVLLQIGGEGGDISIKKIHIDKYTFYAYFTEENYDNEDGAIKGYSPFYHSFLDLWVNFPFPAFDLYPNLKIELDQDIKELLRKKMDHFIKENKIGGGSLRDWSFLLK